MTDKVTFGDFHRLLGECGFVQTPVEGNHVLLEHRTSGTLLAFRLHRPNERVDPMTLSIVRKKLDENGLLDDEQFESSLREVSANGAEVSKQK